MTRSFDLVFDTLKPVYSQYMRDYPTSFNCVVDESDEYYLDTLHIMPNKKPLYFGSVKVCKNYVSFHVMPIYVFPELREGISPELTRCMQGKSCFNFQKSKPELFNELEALVKSGFELYQNAGYV